MKSMDLDKLALARSISGRGAKQKPQSRKLDTKAEAEKELLRTHLPELVGHALRIAADEELRLARPCESAYVSVAYMGTHDLPLGALLELWTGEFHRPAADRFYVLGVGGSPLTGMGTVWGYVGDDRVWTTRPFDRELAFGLLTHPLLSPFQRRVRQGQALDLAAVLERLQLLPRSSQD